jgi:hypothetical protein
MAFVGQVTMTPGATRPGVIDTDQRCGLGWPRAQALITIGLPGAKGAEGAPLSVVRCGDSGHGDGVLVDIETDRPCASVTPG